MNLYRVEITDSELALKTLYNQFLQFHLTEARSKVQRRSLARTIYFIDAAIIEDLLYVVYYQTMPTFELWSQPWILHESRAQHL